MPGARRRDRHRRRRSARPDDRAGRRAARLSLPHPGARAGQPGCPGDQPGHDCALRRCRGAGELRRRRSTWSPWSSRTCRSSRWPRWRGRGRCIRRRRCWRSARTGARRRRFSTGSACRSRPTSRSTARQSIDAALERAGSAGDPQDRAPWLRRQGTGQDRGGHRARRSPGNCGRGTLRPGRLDRFRARDLGDHRSGSGRRTGELRAGREPPSRSDPGPDDRARRRSPPNSPGRRRRWPSRSRPRSTWSGCSRSRCSSPATGGSWSTSWRRGRTTRAIGPSMPAP